MDLELLAERLHPYYGVDSPKHEFCFDIKKLDNKLLMYMFEKLLSMSSENNNSALRQLIINTLISNNVIISFRKGSIDNILEDLNNKD